MSDQKVTGKTCPRCKTKKDSSMFNKSTVRKDRMAVYCRACESDYKKDREKIKKEYDIYGIV